MHNLSQGHLSRISSPIYSQTFLYEGPLSRISSHFILSLRWGPSLRTSLISSHLSLERASHERNSSIYHQWASLLFKLFFTYLGETRDFTPSSKKSRIPKKSGGFSPLSTVITPSFRFHAKFFY